MSAFSFARLIGFLSCGFCVSTATVQAQGPALPPITVESRAYGTRSETEPPRYVRRASETGYDSLSDLDWLLLGADYRVRYEARHHDYRFSTLSDDPLLLRARVFVGIEQLIDPLRFGLELQDARLVHSDVADNTRDVDHHDVLQAYAELYGRDFYGQGEPVRLQYGRIAFEYLDRRLLSRNPWRNTTNNFQGFRLLNGSKNGVAWLDLLALKPVTIEPTERDQADDDRHLFGAIGSYSGWSKFATLQPYALRLVNDQTVQRIDNWGLRAYAVFASGFDYDLVLNLQTGHDTNTQDHRAEGGAFELGYTAASLRWKPRFSGFIGYASGDEDPNDKVNDRFNRFFGFSRPWSASDYQIFENVIAPKLRVELKASSTLQLEAGYGGFWLASDSDTWSNIGRRDRSGQSGDFVGQELDTRVRWKADPHLEIVSGYSHFFTGDFIRNTGASPDSDFFYLEFDFQVFK